VNPDLRDTVLSRYQQQIAKVCHAWCRAIDPADTFNQLNNVAEAVTKTVASVLHAIYRDGTRSRDVDLILDADFARPSVASYLALASEILRATFRAPSASLTRIGTILRDDRDSEPLAAFVNRSRSYRTGSSSTRKKAHLQVFLDEYLQFRHKIRAHGAPNAAVYEHFNDTLCTALECALRKLEPVLTLPLVAIQRIELEPAEGLVVYDVLALNGLADLPTKVNLPLGEVFLSRGAVYVRAEERHYEMSPLLVLRNSEPSFLNEFTSSAFAEYLVHHTGRLDRVTMQVGTREFFGLPLDLRASDIRSRNGIVFNLPSTMLEDFVGRDAEIAELRKALERRSFPIVTLWGWGGSGKSALALKLAYDLLAENDESSLRFDYIVWISAKKTELTPDGIRRLSGSTLRVASVLKEIARVTGASDLVDLDAAPETLARQIQGLFEGTDRLLVIVDNFETFEDDKGFAWEIFKDVAGSIAFLVTSRHKKGEAEQPIHLAGLPEEDSLLLLESEARAKNAGPILASGLPLRRRVIRECDYLPLAIKTVVGWVTKGVSVDTALSGFRAVQGEGIHEFCFEESYELLTESDRLLVFVMAALNEPASRDELHIATGLSLATLDTSLETLANLSILETTRTDDEVVVVQIPNLPRDYFRKRLDVETGFNARVEAAVTSISRLRLDDPAGLYGMPEDLLDAGTSARLAYRYAQLREFADADRFWALAVEANPGHPSLWARKGYYEAMMKGDLDVGLQSLKKALMLDPNGGHWWFIRGIVERKLDNFESAIECFEKARTHGEEEHLVDSNVALALYDQARAEFRRGNRGRARELDQRVVSLVDRSWAQKDDPRAARHNAIVAAKVARSLMFLGKLDEASRVVDRALRGRRGDRELESLRIEIDIRARRT